MMDFSAVMREKDVKFTVILLAALLETLLHQSFYSRVI